MTITRILITWALAFSTVGMFVVPEHMFGVELIERVAETLRIINLGL